MLNNLREYWITLVCALKSFGSGRYYVTRRIYYGDDGKLHDERHD